MKSVEMKWEKGEARHRDRSVRAAKTKSLKRKVRHRDRSIRATKMKLLKGSEATRLFGGYARVDPEMTGGRKHKSKMTSGEVEIVALEVGF